MLCQSLLYSKETQAYTHVHSLSMFFSITVHYKVLNAVPCAYTVGPVVYPF